MKSYRAIYKAALRQDPNLTPVNEELAVAALNYVKRSMTAYLDGKKNLNWIIGVIRSSGVRGAAPDEGV